MNAFLLSVDPGIRGCGIALWSNRVLDVATYVFNPENTGSGAREAAIMAHAVYSFVQRWVVQRPTEDFKHCLALALEWPHTVGGRAHRGDANDLFALAGVVSALVATAGADEVTQYFPHLWKGSTQKPKKAEDKYVIETQARKILSSVENKKVMWTTSAKRNWDIADAIGIGLKWLGRLDKQKSFPRE